MTKALKEALNVLALKVSTKSELKDSLEYQDKALNSPPLFRNKVWPTSFLN
jgi:hypothetical protein